MDKHPLDNVAKPKELSKKALVRQQFNEEIEAEVKRLKANRNSRVKKNIVREITPSLIDDVCLRVALGQSLRDIGKLQGMPDTHSILCWLHPDESVEECCDNALLELFAERYKLALRRRMELDFDELIHIADEATNKDNAAAVKLRVQSRQWVLERVLASVFAQASRVVDEDEDAEKEADKFEAMLRIVQSRREERREAIEAERKANIVALNQEHRIPVGQGGGDPQSRG